MINITRRYIIAFSDEDMAFISIRSASLINSLVWIVNFEFNSISLGIVEGGVHLTTVTALIDWVVFASAINKLLL